MTDDSRADRPGADAAAPRRLGWSGWKQVLIRVKDEIGDDHVPLLSAGVAFYAMLALFPALIAAITMYGIVSDPTDVQRQLDALTTVAPGNVSEVVSEQLEAIVEQPSGGKSLGFLIGLLGALWSASAGVAGLMKAINLAYDEEETRSPLRLRAVAVGLTLGAIVVVLLAFGLIAVLPPLLEPLGLGVTASILLGWLRWPILAVLLLLALAVMYRVGPDREPAKWRWVSWGSVTAVLLWLGASALFSVYVSNFGSYNETYGTLGAAIVLLLWLFIGAFVVLLGAEINSETEHQTAIDSTTGPPEPMGRRGAVVADTRPDRPPTDDG